MKIPIRAKKFLSQNYLIDKNVLEDIVSACNLDENDVVLEIGPGTGVLTQALQTRVGHIYAIEMDKLHYDNLSNNLPSENLTLFNEDFLDFELKKIPKLTKIIGNIPYHISSPIIQKLIENRDLIPKAFLTVQQEFGNRLAAQPGSKSYGSLTCFLQYFADTEILFPIKNTAFKPVPKVTSCFLTINFRDPIKPVANTDLLFNLIHQAFQQRRKKVVNALHVFGDKKKLADIFNQLKINSDARAENLSLNDFIAIYEKLRP